MNQQYTVVIVGMGKRGANHFKHFQKHPSFHVVGVCDRNPQKIANYHTETLGSVKLDELLQRTSPDVVCVCTSPDVRLGLIDQVLKTQVRLIAMEKPIALSSLEAMKINDLLDSNDVKAVVCHQHRYGPHYQKIREALSAGAIGRVHTVYGTGLGWMMHLMTHLLEYMRWFVGDEQAIWVMGQAAGRNKLDDNHPSPDYIGGFIQFSKGIRGIVECGAGAPDVPEVDYWWHKCRIGAQGTDGFAEVLTGGGWRLVNSDGAEIGSGVMDYDNDMPGYIADIARWLDDDKQVHPCRFTNAYHSFEIMMGLCRSVIEGGQIQLPLTTGMNELAVLSKKFPLRPVQLSLSSSAEHYR